MKTPKESSCAVCGMPVGANEYHPYTACVLFMFERDAACVRANLQEVIRWAQDQIRPLKRPRARKKAK